MSTSHSSDLEKDLRSAENRLDVLTDKLRGMSTNHSEYTQTWNSREAVKKQIVALNSEVLEALARKESDDYDLNTAHKS